MSGRARVNLAVRLAIQHGAFVLSVGTRCPLPTGPLRHVAFVSDAEPESLDALARVLPMFDAAAQLTGLSFGDGEKRSQALGATLRSVRPERAVAVVELSSSWAAQAEAIERAAVDAAVDLVVMPSDSLSDIGALVRGFFAADTLQHAERPTLILPRTTSAPALLADRLFASDTLALPGSASPVAAEHIGPLGRARLAPTERLLVGAGTSLSHELGVFALDAELLREAAGAPITLALEHEPLERCFVRALVPTRPLVLVDANAPAELLDRVQPLAADHDVVFVRLRWEDSLEAVRAQLSERAPWSGAPTVLDASAWLDDGGADDLPSILDAQRLSRLATRLALAGAQIGAVVAGTPGADLGDRRLGFPADERELVSDARRVEGNSVRFTLDNAEARETLLAAIRGARRSVCWQCYIVEEGPVAELFAAALRQAAERGVVVRMLVDALYSQHEAFGAKNAVLVGLAAAAGVEVRAYRPLSGLPDLVGLKQRNHRKLVLVDETVAVLTGRNLGAPYYTGFDEVRLTRESSYRDVPWLDCGAIVQGPVVEAVARAFLGDWLGAGGSAFEPGPAPPRAGNMPCRLVVHEGLRDTWTLDTQLSLIRRARHRLVVVNTFPLAIELQRALVAAVRRGVRVQILHGSARPRYAEDVPFSGGIIRTLADQLVRARLDPIAIAGGEVGELALAPLAGWEPELAQVFPHVHAKLIVRDDEEVAVGSANLDVTSAYWESELLLVVEAAEAARELLAVLEPLLVGSRRAAPDDPEWQEEAARRVRLGRSWPALVG
jgi:phosphatidylserine/phosphatidylglycerophosphate/cardiolipin synthase-like enzyme/nucleotide-binding universal stress UspA family protein